MRHDDSLDLLPLLRRPLGLLFTLGRGALILITIPPLALAVSILHVTSRRRAAQLLRGYLERMGGGFIKLGQFLATRFDLVSSEYCHELMNLLDQARPLPSSTILRIVRVSLGPYLFSQFAKIEPAPLGSASIAQVHAATLRDGTAVVIKVRRPGIVRLFQADLFFLRLLSAIPLIPGVDLASIVQGLAELTREELDFRREARSTHQLHQLLASDDIDHRAPAVFRHLSNKNIITLERFEGVWVKDLIDAVASNDTKRLTEWRAIGISPERTARLVLRSFLEQTIGHRIYNADPHPANLIVLKGGTLGWVDFGIVGVLDERTWRQQFSLRLAVAQDDVDRAYEALVQTLEPLPARDLTSFELSTKSAIAEWISSSKDPWASATEKSVGIFLMNVFNAVRRWGITLPTALTRLYRAMIIGDSAMLSLDPQVDWTVVLKEFAVEESAKQLRKAFSVYSPSAFVLTAEVISDVPAAARQLIEWAWRLSETGRTYQGNLSAIERSFLLAVRSLKRLLFLATVLVISTLIWPQTSLSHHLRDFAANRMVLIVAIVLILLRLLSRLESGMEGD
jgi:predicted unusual protein kinase regulating ubiquinone biosynthesis (AarF/ABC1/UbiB family)